MIPDYYVEIKGDDFIIDMMYAKTTNNMTGVPVYQDIGLGNRAFVHRDMWEVLKKVIPILRQKNLKMKICDAARPISAHKKFLEIIPIKGFFAQDPVKSQHCHGTAIDVCLCTPDGQELSYPTKVDAYTPDIAADIQHGNTDTLKEHLVKARHDYYPEGMETEIANRENLKEIMESIGLVSIEHEWWHYDLPNGKQYPLFDL
ncbi:MAG: hypothetical protein E7019_06810 [Alphaproteobacteria bacterium]|nr:hypothetical protein [Alphaproteobacteria bacterium]